MTDPSPSTNGDSHTPRDSKGWDGKLRIGKAAEEDEAAREAAEGPTPPDSDDEPDTHPDAPPGSTILDDPHPGTISADEDLLADVPASETDIDLNHSRITSIPALNLSRFPALARLCLRQNRIASIHLPADWGASLTELDLYDNAIAHIKGLDALPNLTTLDLSFNSIRHIKRLTHLKCLTDLFFVQNRITHIAGLDDLPALRNLELGGNRLRDIENLHGCPALEELWLGKNKISALRNLEPLGALRLLSIQSNRLTADTLGHLAVLPALEELYISHNLLDSVAPLAACAALRVVDISSNPVASIAGVGALRELEEFWASDCRLESFEEIGRELADKAALTTVYFEGNPLQRRQPVLYRGKVRMAVPQVRQIDATFVRVD